MPGLKKNVGLDVRRPVDPERDRCNARWQNRYRPDLDPAAWSRHRHGMAASKSRTSEQRQAAAARRPNSAPRSEALSMSSDDGSNVYESVSGAVKAYQTEFSDLTAVGRRVLVRLERRALEPDGVGEGHDVGNDGVRAVVIGWPLDEADLGVEERRRGEPRVARRRGASPDGDHVRARRGRRHRREPSRTGLSRNGQLRSVWTKPSVIATPLRNTWASRTRVEADPELTVVIRDAEGSTDEQVLAWPSRASRSARRLAQPPGRPEHRRAVEERRRRRTPRPRSQGRHPVEPSCSASHPMRMGPGSRSRPTWPRRPQGR